MLTGKTITGAARAGSGPGKKKKNSFGAPQQGLNEIELTGWLWGEGGYILIGVLSYCNLVVKFFLEDDMIDID